MDNENWYRQLLGLVLVSVTRGVVEWITNPSSREDATRQMRDVLASIDYDAAARAITSTIDSMADTSKGRITETIDTLREKGIEAVDDAKTKVEVRSGKKRKGGRKKFLVGLAIGGVIAYFVLDEQRRDEMLDRLTGASGPIDQSSSSIYQQASDTAQKAAEKVSDTAQKAADKVSDTAQKAAEKVSDTAQKAAEKAPDSAQKAAEKVSDPAKKSVDKAPDTTV
jgi:hypothetical protein